MVAAATAAATAATVIIVVDALAQQTPLSWSETDRQDSVHLIRASSAGSLDQLIAPCLSHISLCKLSRTASK